MKTARLFLLAALALTLGGATPSAFAVPLAFNEKGLHVDAGGMGEFELTYPSLETKSGKESKIMAREPAENSTTVRYDDGAILHAAIGPDGAISYAFDHVPADTTNLRYEMLIDFSFQVGGKWKFQDGPAHPFPVEKPADPHFFQGHASHFEISDAAGRTLVLAWPPFSYVELQDNRAWNWSVYEMVSHVPLVAGDPHCTITISLPGTAQGKAIPIVDKFGQLKALDWPEKIKSEDELKKDAAKEGAYYSSFPAPVVDAFGGELESGKRLDLKSTGYFHVEQKGAKWFLIDPDGNLFFHLGVCGFAPGDDYTTVKGRHDSYDWLPPLEGEFRTAYLENKGDDVFSFHLANMLRKYGQPYELGAFQSRMIDRVRAWGFNSIGAFSPINQPVVEAKHFPYVRGLPLDPGSGKIPRITGITETWDPFEPANIAQMNANFAKVLPAHANDPLLIGYFLTNEPLYEEIPKVVPGLKGSSFACKRELVQELKAKYPTIDAFNAAWGLSAASFEALQDDPLPVTTKSAASDLQEFTGKFLETYFQAVDTAFHQYDTHHMLIGNRLQPGTINNEQLCRIAGKHLDVMSFNYYTDGIDKDFLHRIYGWTGRPMFLSEFYWAASRESGLVGGRDVATEQERGLAYRNYVEQSASLGCVVGIEWFSLVDQAATGRWFSGFSGERSNIGLISVADRPWYATVAEMAKTNDEIYQVLNGDRLPFAWDNPRFTSAGDQKRETQAPHATGTITLDATTQNWPGVPPEVISGKHVVTGSDSGGVEGSFKVCWDEKNLYLLVTILDPTPLQNVHAQPADAWDGDALEIFLGSEKMDEGGPLLFTDRHLVIPAGGAGKVTPFCANQPGSVTGEAMIVPGADQKSYTVEAAVPWTSLGVTPSAGTELRLDLAIDDSINGKYRIRQITWNGTDKNSGDRTHWGRVKLLP